MVVWLAVVFKVISGEEAGTAGNANGVVRHK